jgi:bacterioferritin
MPTAKALPVKISENAVEMLRADLENANATVRAYRQRVKECEALGTRSTSRRCWARTCLTCRSREVLKS